MERRKVLSIPFPDIGDILIHADAYHVLPTKNLLRCLAHNAVINVSMFTDSEGDKHLVNVNKERLDLIL